MHTPRPAPEPEPMPGVSSGTQEMALEDGWAIFDHRSMELATQSLGFENIGVGNGVNGPSMASNTAMANNDGMRMGNHAGGAGHASVGGQEPDGYGNEWMAGTENYSDAWQNTLFRLFGNTEGPGTEGL